MRTIEDIKQDMQVAENIITGVGSLAKVYSGNRQAEVDYAESNLNCLAIELLAAQSSPAKITDINIGVVTEDGEGGSVKVCSIREVFLWAMGANDVVSITYPSGTPRPIEEALESVGVYKNIKVFTYETVFLTVDGKVIHEIPADKAETIVYEIQKKLDEAAVLEGREFGKLVSTRRAS